jgi:hypothetical protein
MVREHLAVGSDQPQTLILRRLLVDGAEEIAGRPLGVANLVQVQGDGDATGRNAAADLFVRQWTRTESKRKSSTPLQRLVA